ncbi:MAG: hypothetical protein Q9M12_01985, partial [Mariprofundus sp.]|nr:hypothetical protein [Mariprofundus sp.]
SSDLSGQIELYPDDIAKFTIWQAPDEIQTTDHISKTYLRPSQMLAHLLECAKRAVEIAIEQDEDAAMKWLKTQTQER